MATNMTNYLAELRIADVDTGEAGMPGTGASEDIARIWVRRRGGYRATCSKSTGCNQGYYQENYHHGTWAGRGRTIDEAISAALRGVPAEWRADMTTALAAAMDEADDQTYADAARSEAERLEAIISAGADTRPGVEAFCRIGGHRTDWLTPDARMDLRRRAAVALRRAAGPSPLAGVTDDEIRRECNARGLILEGGR